MRSKVARKQDGRFDVQVPLSRQAMDALRAARAFAPRRPLVFPSQRHAHKPISKNVIGYFYNRLAIRARHVPYGWRSTFSTVMNERAHALGRPGDHRSHARAQLTMVKTVDVIYSTTGVAR
ncbi:MULTISPECIES: hypothetical protein [unclassified Sphingomonas]|uniref:hypothetical protein n=1 Tax=unclassified Sphingomonas TaxID=196159 RepID=UPI000700063E|nr:MULTISPECIES: hypothetical protein [unclassified Sphingomonas]KQS49728.1 hypothetical protein ASG20_12265 [Sphingomonas sp. Leaf198]